MNKRVRPQDLQEPTLRLVTSPLIRAINAIDTSHVTTTPWYPGKWKARHREFLKQENRRLKELRRQQAIRNTYR